MAVGQVREVVDVSCTCGACTVSVQIQHHQRGIILQYCTVCIISKFMLQYIILIVFYIDMFVCCMHMYMCVCATAGLY